MLRAVPILPRMRALALLVAAGVVLVAIAPGAAAEPPPTAIPLPLEAVGDLASEIVAVPLSGEAYVAAHGDWVDAKGSLVDAIEVRADAEVTAEDRADAVVWSEGSLVSREAARAEAEQVLADRQAAHRATTAVLAEQRARMVDLAVTEFMVAGSSEDATSPEYAEDERMLRQDVLGRAVGEAGVSRFADAGSADAAAAAEAAAAAVARDEAAGTVVDAAGEVERARADREAALQAADDAARDVVAAQADVEWRRELLVAAVPTGYVAGTDLAVVVLDAYLEASRWEGSRCGLHWSVLAGIGRVESRHGSYRGSQLDTAGNVSPPIIGIALDGTNETQAIADTDGGLLDGDPVTDRAVGPMQFIPSTWASTGVDGNGDGVADPQNLYDTAASAARYLCRAAPVGSGLEAARAAVFSYNHDLVYVDTVLGWAGAYGTELILPVPPPD